MDNIVIVNNPNGTSTIYNLTTGETKEIYNGK